MVDHARLIMVDHANYILGILMANLVSYFLTLQACYETINTGPLDICGFSLSILILFFNNRNSDLNSLKKRKEKTPKSVTNLCYVK